MSGSGSVVRGEDVESDGDGEGQGQGHEQVKTRSSAQAPPVISVTGSGPVKVVTFGEEEEAGEYSDVDDFGSSISLGSGHSLELDDPLMKLDHEAAAVLGPILPQRRSPRLDPAAIRKHRERNRSLRTNIADKFLTPVINQSARKIEKLSQNLSNSQIQMQDALFQSRIATANLLKLQKDLEFFLEEDYLKELKILPSDEDGHENDGEEGEKSQTESHSKSEQSFTGVAESISKMTTSSASILTAALSGAAHLI